MAKKLTMRVWILIIAVILSIFAISPSPWAEGIEITSVREGSPSDNAGVSANEIVLSVNNKQTRTLTDYKDALEQLRFIPVDITLVTDKGTYAYTTTGDLGFVQSNLTIQSFGESLSATGIGSREKIVSINGQPITVVGDVSSLENELFTKVSFVLTTDKQEYAYLITKPPEIRVEEARKSNINKGLELQGGTRVLLEPISDEKLDHQQLTDVIAVLNNRLNTYGLADLKIRSASDLEGNDFVLVEIAGASREEVRELIGQQGKFEAKIGVDQVFTGGEGDVKYVCRNDATCSGIIPPCNQLAEDQWSCTFQFSITLSERAAKMHAQVTELLEVNVSAGGNYLSKPIDFYLDDQQVDSLRIAAELKGRDATQISITGPGFGPTEEAAYEEAIDQMNKLQTILITGSLPVKLEIVKLDTISPVLGQEFVRNAFLVAALALLGVAIVIFAVYRKVKIVVPMLITMLSEILIILGIASLIQWNLDLAAIAGIIAAVGTGIDDQIVITDEAIKGGRYLNWKEKVKRAFFIIMTAYLTTVVAMIPLWFAGAGLIRGFAVTTIIGITVGVFITRPAFASMIEKAIETE